MLQAKYEIVLSEVIWLERLAAYLNGDQLAAVRPRLFVSKA
jgi:hypothetical protein